MAAMGEKPSMRKTGGNIAGVTIPRAVAKEPKPIPTKSACSSLVVAIPLMYSISL